MKAKFLFILLSVLFIIPTDAATVKKGKSRSRIHSLTIEHRKTTRSFLEFDMTVEDKENTLIVLFQSSLPDAEITITDKDGNVVAHEPLTFIYEGKVLHIYTPNAYPYAIEIISPTMDVTGEIVQEEI